MGKLYRSRWRLESSGMDRKSCETTYIRDLLGDAVAAKSRLPSLLCESQWAPPFCLSALLAPTSATNLLAPTSLPSFTERLAQTPAFDSDMAVDTMLGQSECLNAPITTANTEPSHFSSMPSTVDAEARGDTISPEPRVEHISIANKVTGTMELLEIILAALPAKDLLPPQHASEVWRELIRTSSLL